ncbi:MAG: hypothetical protein ACK4N5_22525, partial [Myxococcales bacterium]
RPAQPADAGVAAATPPAPTGPREFTLEQDVAAAQAAVRPLVAKCFEEAEKLYFGTQRVVLQGVLEVEGGRGVLKEPQISESTLRDAKSHACFLRALNKARFRAPTGGAGQPAVMSFNHVPAAQ